MSQKTLSDYVAISPILLFLRRNINYVCFFLFLYYTKGKCFYAIKTAITIVMFSRWHRDTPRQPDGAQSPAYQDLFSLYNIEVLAITLTAGVTVCAIGMCLVWVTDILGSYKSMMTREARHMRYWGHQETKSLERQGRLIASLKSSAQLEVVTLNVIKRLEAIILRYEQSAAALNPDRPVKAKLSEKPDTFYDLFDGTKDTARQAPKVRAIRRVLKFKSKP